MLPNSDEVGSVVSSQAGDVVDPVWVGSLADMSDEMLSALQDNGYSLMQDDVTIRVKRAMRYWASWGIFYDQRNIAAGQTKALDEIKLTSFEWTQIWELARVYCDQLQAVRMDAVRGLGTEPWGVSPQEAEQMVQMVEEKIPKTAFVEGAFSLTLAGDVPQAIVDFVQRKAEESQDTTFVGSW